MKTVSRVFNGEPHVRPVTYDRVMQTAQELDYRPNLSARRLATNRSFVIGMLYDNPNSDYVTEVQYGALRVCREHGYSLLIHPCEAQSNGLVDEVFDLYRQATVDGFVNLQPVSDLEDLNRALLDNGIATVRVSQRSCDGLPWISVGDEEGAADMTEYLLDLGHRRIGFIIGHPDHGTSHDRLAGYRTALERHDIRFDPLLVEQGFFDYESGYSAALKLLHLQPRPTAIFASNDRMAMGVLTAAHQTGLEIPRELSVAGFDDSSIARFAWPQLTTVRQPIRRVAEVATRVLLAQLQGRLEQVSDHHLQADIVSRDSTGPAS